MSYTFSHTFPVSSEIQSHSKSRKIENVKWTAQFTLENRHIKINISNKLIGEIACPLVPWKITFDVRYTFGALTNTRGSETTINYTRLKEDVCTSELLCFEDQEAFTEKEVLKVKVKISQIRTIGIHQFERKVFENPISNEDLVLNVNGEKLHCHSQILSWNSKVFKGMIEKNPKPTSLDNELKPNTDPPLHSVSGNEAASEICLEDTIPVKDLRELLHYIYFPFEPVDVHNLKQLLHWGKKFEVNHIVQLCQQFMKTDMLDPDATHEEKIEMFLLSWKYSFEPLKKIYVSNVNPQNSTGWMKDIVRSELYQNLDNEMKPKMWEFLVESGI